MDELPQFKMRHLLIFMLVVGVLTVYFNVLGAGTLLFGTEIDRRVVESSRQYAETNTSLFYTKANAIKKIDVQLAGLTAGDPMIAALKSQRELLVNEARMEVAKIPSDARTADMIEFGGGR